MFGLYMEARIDVLVNKSVIKYSYLRECIVPVAILEYKVMGPTVAIKNNVRRP